MDGQVEGFSVTKTDSAHVSRAYWWYSVGLLGILLTSCLAVGFAMQSATRHIEAALVNIAGRGLMQSATALAESLNRVLFEHALHSQTLAQTPLLRRADPEALATYLQALKTTWPDYMNLQVVDAAGHVMVATDSSQVGKDEGPHAWYKALRQGGRLDLRGTDLFEHTGRLMLFPAPIVGDEGQFLGAVVLQVGLQSVEFILDAAKRSPALRSIPARLEYQLVTNDGMVLYDSTDRDSAADRHAWASGKTLSGLAKPGYREERHPQRNAEVVLGYAPVNRYGQVPEWQWTLLIRMDREAILTPFHRLVATMMMWGGLALLGFMAVLLWIIGRLKHASEAPRRAVGQTAPVASAAEAKRSPQRTDRDKGRRALVGSPEPRAKMPAPSTEVVVPAREQWEELRRWVRLAEVNRVCLFKNHRGEDGELWVSRRYEWIGLGEVARTEWSQWFSWSLRAKGFSRWEHTLAEGHTVSGRWRRFRLPKRLPWRRAAFAPCWWCRSLCATSGGGSSNLTTALRIASGRNLNGRA
jgi:hypothetical protein